MKCPECGHEFEPEELGEDDEDFLGDEEDEVEEDVVNGEDDSSPDVDTQEV